MMRAEYKTARELGEQLLTLAQSVQDPAFLLPAHYGLGVTLFLLGELTPAREHFEQGIALYDLQQYHSLAYLYGGYDPLMSCPEVSPRIYTHCVCSKHRAGIR